MRQQLREMFGNLGNRLRTIDDAYADKVLNMVAPDPEMTGPRRVVGEVISAPLGYGVGKSSINPDENMKGYLAETMGAYAIPAASATARYVVPGAMITAAGAGLADLTQNFYDSMSDTPVLPS